MIMNDKIIGCSRHTIHIVGYFSHVIFWSFKKLNSIRVPVRISEQDPFYLYLEAAWEINVTQSYFDDTK